MNISRKISKLACFIIFLIIFAFLSSAMPLTQSQENILSPALQVTAITDKESYLLRQKVIIEGNITEDGTPVSDLVVIVQAKDPIGADVAYRTITIGNPTQTWQINITGLFLMDMSSNLINTAKIGTTVQAGITVYNPQVTARTAYITVTVFDANMVPLGVGVWSVSLDPRQTVTPRFWIYIPKTACTGKVLIVGNVYSEEPKNGGMALSLEKPAYFCISKTQSGLFEYPSLPPPPPQTTPGFYSTYIRLPPDPSAGKYTVYVNAQTSEMTMAPTSTTFNVENSGEYPPQASFAFWPAAPYENMTVQFDASSSTPEGFNDVIIRYEWDFGDGTSKVIKEGTPSNPPDPTATHKYPYNFPYMQAKQYTIILNVTDNEGLWCTTSKPITIYPEFGPTVNFTWTPKTPVINETVTFDASNSTIGWSKEKGAFSPIISYEWNFSDGTGIITVPQPQINHAFTDPENYTVTLKVTDDAGRFASTSAIVQVLNVTVKDCDLNGDGVIDGSDLIIVTRAYGSYPGHPDWNQIADVNRDDVVDGSDVILVARHYGEDP